jgi:membrane fusion protein, multidrug efflux system
MSMEFPLETEDRTNSAVKITHAGRRRWWVWVFAALLTGLLAYTGWIFSGKRASGQGPPPSAYSVPVVVATANKGDIPVYLTGLGTVTALYTATILPQVTGQILQVPFKEGDFVKKGALLVQIDPQPYEAALLQAQGQLQRDKALLEQAKRDFKRYDILAKQDSIAQQIRDDQEYLVHQNEGTVKLDEGLVQSAKINLAYTRISAPFTGRIGLRLVDPGNIVYTPDSNGIAVMTQEQPITVIFPIPEDNLPAVFKRLKAKENLPVEAFDRGGNALIATGRLQSVDNQINVTTGTVNLKAVFTNEDNALFPNQFVNASLLMETLRGVTVAPTSAIQHSPKGTFVYVVKEDQTVTVRWVKTGPSEGDQVSIEQGVSPGEIVVVEGAEKLKEGSKVEVQKQAAGSSNKGN